MENNNDKQQAWTARSILTAFTNVTKAGEFGRQYVLSRHHQIEKPKHGLDYTRITLNPNKRDDGRAMAVLA